MKYFFLLGYLLCYAGGLSAQIQLDNIKIARDKWGVPHIFTKTDEEAAYALAWAHAEDNFAQIQEPLLSVRNLLGSVKGQEGALFDALSFLMDIDGLVEKKYAQTFSPKFKKILQAYCSGLNRYAALHPEELLLEGVFPIGPKDIIKGYTLSFSLISNIQFDIGRLFQNQLAVMRQISSTTSAGSNGIAIAPHKTTENKTYLVSNSHQPFRSYLSWYEVHIHTEEGWNFTGATFAGGITPFIGTNENIGWTHCVNYHDFNDVFELKMHPKDKLKYYFDGQWLDLEERSWKTKVKLGFLKIGIKKKFYRSVHGPVIKNKTGFFALRFAANMVVGAAEQWYHMNKSTNLEEFKQALDQQQFPNLSIIYADKKGNILFSDNGLFPHRNPAYDWTKIVPGDTSATLWSNKFMPMDSLIEVFNPASGYVFHVNGTGFNCTADAENPRPEQYNPTIGYIEQNSARNIRFQRLIKNYDQLSYADLKKIKYDQHRDFPLFTRSIQNWDLLRQLSPKEHPNLADIIAVFSKWTGAGDVDNQQAAIFALAGNYISKYTQKNGLADIEGILPETVYPKAMAYAKRYLKRHFGRLEIALGDLQKHVRGDKILPVGGLAESLAALYVVPYKKGIKQSNLGDSFILFATYGPEGIERIESINCYGSSNRPESPHYNDQMELYLQQKTKTISLDKIQILKDAVRIYAPQ